MFGNGRVRCMKVIRMMDQMDVNGTQETAQMFAVGCGAVRGTTALLTFSAHRIATGSSLLAGATHSGCGAFSLQGRLSFGLPEG